MNYRISSIILAGALLALPASAQTPAQTPRPPAANTAGAVSVASMNEINRLLTDVQRTSEATAVDIAGLRIDRWKADSGSKRQAQENSDAILRNLQTALPGMVSEVRTAPEDLAPSFNLYRNLDALYDVLGSQTELVGAFGPKDQYQALSRDLGNLEQIRRNVANRIQNLAHSRDLELARLRTEVRAAQAAAAAPPKKTIVDDEEPPKKVVKKKKRTPTKHTTAGTANQEKSSQPPPQE